MLLRRELSYLRGEAGDPSRRRFLVDDSFGGRFRQAARSISEGAGGIFRIFGFHGALQFLNEVLDA